jgi:hypothetical protein
MGISDYNICRTPEDGHLGSFQHRMHLSERECWSGLVVVLVILFVLSR